MGSDPKKTGQQDEDLDEGSTAMFSREAHGWFSSMADNQEADPTSVADLGRNAVVETSPLSRTGAAPTTSKTPGATRAQTPIPPAVGSVGAPSASRAVPQSHTVETPSILAKLGGKQVVIVAFLAGALMAVLLGGIAVFLLTAR